ncbi:MAG: TolC family protein, partial [Deltaproteobacteria bacterium]|nr:TolC family protein [Deltaproteobacteria bacterium]
CTMRRGGTRTFLQVISFFIFFFASGCISCPAAEPAEKEMTVEEAIMIGLQNNYNIRIARNTARIAENNRGRGLAGFLPKLDAAESYRYDGVNENTGSPASFGNSDTRLWTSDIQLSWTLFDGFRMFADKRRYDELARAGTSQSRDQIESTVVSIMASFFNLVQQQQLLDVALTNRDISRVRLDREEIRQELGGASSTDILNARVDFNKDQSTLLDQELVVTIARNDLNILLARDPLDPLNVVQDIQVEPLKHSFDELLAMARDRNSTLRTARYNQNASEENVRIAKSAFWPRVDLSGIYGYSDRSLFGRDVGPMADRNAHAINAGVGLVMSFNMFNGDIDRINLQNSRIESINSMLNVRDIENRIAGLMQEKYTTFLKRMEKLRLEEQNLDTARLNLERQKERYATGASDSLDFRDAQVNYAQAQVRLIVARYDARIAQLEVEKLTSRIAID